MSYENVLTIASLQGFHNVHLPTQKQLEELKTKRKAKKMKKKEMRVTPEREDMDMSPSLPIYASKIDCLKVSQKQMS